MTRYLEKWRWKHRGGWDPRGGGQDARRDIWRHKEQGVVWTRSIN